MNVQHVNIKIPIEGDLPIGLEEFIPVFHRWIREAPEWQRVAESGRWELWRQVDVGLPGP